MPPHLGARRREWPTHARFEREPTCRDPRAGERRGTAAERQRGRVGSSGELALQGERSSEGGQMTPEQLLHVRAGRREIASIEREASADWPARLVAPAARDRYPGQGGFEPCHVVRPAVGADAHLGRAEPPGPDARGAERQRERALQRVLVPATRVGPRGQVERGRRRAAEDAGEVEPIQAEVGPGRELAGRELHRGGRAGAAAALLRPQVEGGGRLLPVGLCVERAGEVPPQRRARGELRTALASTASARIARRPRQVARSTSPAASSAVSPTDARSCRRRKACPRRPAASSSASGAARAWSSHREGRAPRRRARGRRWRARRRRGARQRTPAGRPARDSSPRHRAT